MHLDDKEERARRELNDFRQMLAADFHDETGSLLLAIIHQASLLKMQVDKDSLHIVESILDSSSQLFAASKHLLWNLNYDSDDPCALFEYIAAFGQSFYNKFDVCFSTEHITACPGQCSRLKQFAALNLIFIFKEAMNNVIKHAGAKEVVFKMKAAGHHLTLELADDGVWKEPDAGTAHYGLSNIERRCTRNNFSCRFRHDNSIGTQVEITVPLIPVHTNTIDHAALGYEKLGKLAGNFTVFPQDGRWKGL